MTVEPFLQDPDTGQILGRGLQTQKPLPAALSAHPALWQKVMIPSYCMGGQNTDSLFHSQARDNSKIGIQSEFRPLWL